MAEASFEEFTSGQAAPAALSFEEFAGPRKVSPFARGIASAKRMGGEAAAVADLVLSMPGFIVGVGAQLGATVMARASGVPGEATPGTLYPFTAFTVGREAGREVGEPLTSPLYKVMQMFQSGEAYEQATTSQGMAKLTAALEKAGVWVEHATGGRVSRDAIPMFAEVLMAGSVGLARGGRPGEVPAHVQKALRESQARLREQGELEARADVVTPEEFITRVPVQKQINDLLAIRTPAEQARITRLRRKEVQETLTRGPSEEPLPPEVELRRTRQYGDIGESQFRAEERLQREKAQQPMDQARALEILQKPGFERTAEDLIALRAARQKGGARPEVLGLLTAAGIGTTLGAELDDEKLRGAILGGATGLAAALPFVGRGAAVPSMRRQAGAVKAPGGMWHPEAVERLAEPLRSNISRPGENLELTNAWSDRAIRNYLNRYAGTERDPLKDVEIPYEGGVRRWEELMDYSVGKADIAAIKEGGFGARIWADFPGSENIPKGEKVYGLGNFTGGAGRGSFGAIKSYLSHVGDYLRQNVDPVKLQQYDLVRAVRETAENDRRVAREMEKTQKASTEQLLVYKEYPDGFKWVELKLPEKLTKEQARGIGTLTKEQKQDILRPRPEDAALLDKELYVALDNKNKPVRNAYTEELAFGGTPEEAWLAGRLAEEGNQMGHCFPPGTLVTGPAPQLIERLRVGDSVITHTGATRSITEVFRRRYQGPLFTISTRGQLPFSCTEEHPLLAVRPVSTGSPFQDRYINNRLPESLLPQWIKAHELRVGDYLLSAGIQQGPTNPELKDFAWLCGLYAGDGHCEEARIGFTLSPQDDIERVKRTLDTLGYRGRFEDHDTYWRVKVNSVELSKRFGDWFGRFSQEKHLPAFLLQGDASFKDTLAGLTEADGTYYEGRWRFVSTSVALAQQVWLLAVSLGYRPSIKTLKRKAGHGFTNASDAWVVEWQEEKGKWHSNIRWNSFYATPVIEISKEAYSGPVYNIEVADDHSYLVNGLAVHNCVGGYCEGVASGESRIFSLRDPKGLSHVTVEVIPPDQTPRRLIDLIPDKVYDEFINEIPVPAGGWPRGEPHASLLKWLKTRHPDILAQFRDAPSNIAQIKGKQNRAPEAKYLPYVQDFVKGGKWGEVGDLENTGLVDVRGMSEAGYARARLYEEGETLNQVQAEHVVRKFRGRDFVTRDEWKEALQESPIARGPRNERGSIDQRLVMGLGGLGLGGILGTYLADDPSGALLGALAGASLGLPGVQHRLKQVAEGADYGLGAISTRVGNLSPALRLRSREYEMRVLTESHRRLHQVAPFMAELEKLPRDRRRALDIGIMNNDPGVITQAMKGNPALVAAWRQTRNALDQLGTALMGYGRFKALKDDYFPRLVKDVEGLKAALGAVERTRLERALKEAQDRSMRSRGVPLSGIEESAIINREVAAIRHARISVPGFARLRKVQEVTEGLLPFYHTPSEALFAYVRGAVQDLEAARFFGKEHLVQRRVGGQEFVDVNASIGNVVGRELRSGKINHAQAQQLINILQSRFQRGERASAGVVQDLRNLGNMGLLGNIVSGATQGADALMAVYAQDLRSTISAMTQQAAGRGRLKAKDFGLADHIAEEFVSGSSTANWLNRMFKYSGFSAIDRFGKTTMLNAALDKYQRLSDTAGGVERIRRKYGEAYKEEFPALVGDLKAGRLSERVRLLLFSELSDMQPISKMEMPQAYLDMPNGRLVYMLKTFMLKQFDVVRRDAYNEIKKGNVVRGIKNLTEYALVLGLAGAATQMVKDWLMGREVRFDLTDVAENALKTFGWSEYVRERAAQGRPIEALVGTFAPPYRMMDDIIRRDPKAVQYIPLVGKLYYNWELGGREEAELREARKARKRGEEPSLSSRAELYRERKREQARERREREQAR